LASVSIFIVAWGASYTRWSAWTRYTIWDAILIFKNRWNFVNYFTQTILTREKSPSRTICAKSIWTIKAIATRARITRSSIWTGAANSLTIYILLKTKIIKIWLLLHDPPEGYWLEAQVCKSLGFNNWLLFPRQT